MDKNNQIMEALIGNLELSIEILTENKHYKAAESIEKAIYHLNSDKVSKELSESTKMESMKMNVIKDIEESGGSEVEI